MKRKFHIYVEVTKTGSTQFKRRHYEVVAETRASAEREALTIAKEEWADARLPEDRVF